MHLKRFLAATAIATTLSAGSSALYAQGIITGSLSGTVQDPTGAIVPRCADYRGGPCY